MKHDPIPTGKRKAVNLSLDTGVVDAARAAGINLSQVSEAALLRAARDARDRQWQEDHRAWAAAHNQWVEANRLPLEDHRLF